MATIVGVQENPLVPAKKLLAAEQIGPVPKRLQTAVADVKVKFGL
jgi:hypothetical protein